MMSRRPPAPEMTIGRQGHYAGAATRLVAFAMDIGVLWGVSVVVTGLIALTTDFVVGHQIRVNRFGIVTAVLVVLWAFVYFAYQWSLSGRTVGMAILGLAVVARDGAPVTARSAIIRTLVLPFSILLLGLGLVGIIVNRERLALHDRAASTAVVYSWDARAGPAALVGPPRRSPEPLFRFPFRLPSRRPSGLL